jgi:hypothetical protein
MMNELTTNSLLGLAKRGSVWLNGYKPCRIQSHNAQHHDVGACSNSKVLIKRLNSAVYLMIGVTWLAEGLL